MANNLNTNGALPRRTFLATGIGAAIGVSTLSNAQGATEPVPDTDIVLDGIDTLYEAAYTALETGYRRLDTGQLSVSAHHRLLHCKGEMVAWWLAKPKTPDEFRRWHPKDHVSIETVQPDRADPGRTGSVSRVRQYVGGELTESIIEGRNPNEYFDVDRLMDSGASAVICSRGKLTTTPFWGNRIIHVCRDYDWGCEVRSRFWLGPFAPVDSPPPPETMYKLLPEKRAASLLKHTLEEYTYLSSFLPDLFRAEQG